MSKFSSGRQDKNVVLTLEQLDKLHQIRVAKGLMNEEEALQHVLDVYRRYCQWPISSSNTRELDVTPWPGSPL